MDLRELLGGIALIGFAVYSALIGNLQIGRHELAAVNLTDSPGIFWLSTLGLICAGCIFIYRGTRSTE